MNKLLSSMCVQCSAGSARDAIRLGLCAGKIILCTAVGFRAWPSVHGLHSAHPNQAGALLPLLFVLPKLQHASQTSFLGFNAKTGTRLAHLPVPLCKLPHLVCKGPIIDETQDQQSKSQQHTTYNTQHPTIVKHILPFQLCRSDRQHTSRKSLASGMDYGCTPRYLLILETGDSSGWSC